jgi:hypothetical protein
MLRLELLVRRERGVGHGGSSPHKVSHSDAMVVSIPW